MKTTQKYYRLESSSSHLHYGKLNNSGQRVLKIYFFSLNTQGGVGMNMSKVLRGKRKRVKERNKGKL